MRNLTSVSVTVTIQGIRHAEWVELHVQVRDSNQKVIRRVQTYPQSIFISQFDRIMQVAINEIYMFYADKGFFDETKEG